MAEFKCTICGYKFKSRGAKQEAPKRCPACSREDTLRRLDIPINDLLKEVGSDDYQDREGRR